MIRTLDSLFSNNVLPQSIIDGLIEDPDSIQARTSLEMDGTQIFNPSLDI